MSTNFNVIFKGIGGYLPEKIVTNHDFSESLETSDEWIVTRTGISQRHIAGIGQETSDLAYKAGERALQDAQKDPAELDCILVATSTPDMMFPPCAVRVKNLLGATNAVAFDMNVACSGFVFALSVARNFILAKQFSSVLVIGAESLSKIVDWSDRRTAVLFGDGAGAVLLEKEETLGSSERGILDISLFTDNKGYDSLYVQKQTAECGPKIMMNGQEVFRNAVQYLQEASENILRKANIDPQELDFVIPHQANKRIIDAVTERLKISSEKVLMTISDHANTSSASIPLTLWKKKHLLKKNDLILLQAFGAGYTGGICLLRF